ncbi:uncharacterized protein [Hetaerina americana]|uniref:uncharacterized protein n=1 Tax=Hetaerina americana TaxID=62018 RepID=UPI003A7F1118
MSYLLVFNEDGEFDMRLWHELCTTCGGKLYDIDLNKPTLLHDVNNIKDFRKFLSYGAQVNGQDENGCTPLMYAVEHDKGLEFVSELLNYGADVNMQNWEEDCIREVTQMKADKVNESLSLFEFMITKKLNTAALLSTNEDLKKINDEVLIYTGSDERVRGGRVVLDYYSAHDVAKYLSNDDLLNLKIALHENLNPTSGFVNAPAELMQQKTLNNTTTQHHTK